MRFSKQRREELVSLVLEQIQEDFTTNNTDGIYALLLDCPSRALLGFLPQSTVEYLGVAPEFE